MNETQVYNFIRALTKPYPGAFTYKSNGKKVNIYKASLTKKKFPNLEIGQVIKKNKKIFVKTKNKLVQIDHFVGSLKNLEKLK